MGRQAIYSGTRLALIKHHVSRMLLLALQSRAPFHTTFNIKSSSAQLFPRHSTQDIQAGN